MMMMIVMMMMIRIVAIRNPFAIAHICRIYLANI